MFSGKHFLFYIMIQSLGRMVRILFLRDWDAICEEGNEGVLESEIMEEGIISMNVVLL